VEQADVTGTWAVVATEEFEEWMMNLTDKQRDAVEDRIKMLRVHGPALPRPTVGHITNSRHKNMKELRCTSGGHLRVLFMFMPNQEGVMLFGGLHQANGEIRNGTTGINMRFRLLMT
jgi:hypothetical protein